MMMIIIIIIIIIRIRQLAGASRQRYIAVTSLGRLRLRNWRAMPAAEFANE